MSNNGDLNDVSTQKSFEQEMGSLMDINIRNEIVNNKHYSYIADTKNHDYITILNSIPGLISEKEKKAKFVEKLVDVTCNIINVIWANLTVNPNAKVIPLKVFVRETLRRSKTSYSTLQATLYYLLRIKSKIDLITANANSANQDNFQQQNIFNNATITTTNNNNSSSKNNPATCCRRMFLAALIVASKYLQDCNYSNNAWSKISGLPVKEINMNEICFLRLIDYNLFVSEDHFKHWSNFLLKHIQDTLYNDINKCDAMF